MTGVAGSSKSVEYEVEAEGSAGLSAGPLSE